MNPKSGGPIEGIRQLGQAHKKFGHSLEIVSLDLPSAAFLSFPAVPVFPLQRSWLDRFFPITLLRWLKAHAANYDAVIVDGIWGWHITATWLALRHSATPYFVFTHGMLDPWFRRTYPLKHLKKWLVWPWAIHPALRDAEAVLFTCEAEKQLARQSFWLYSCNEVALNYGTKGIPDSSRNYAAAFLEQHPAIANRHRLLFLGRVHVKKAPDLLLLALSDLLKQGIWDPQTMVLVMAGPAVGAYAEQLTHLAADLGLAASVYWTGMLQGDQKWGAFQSADAFVLPSHQENFGIAVAEALSCSTPVLISHAVNIAAEIAADGAGLVASDTRPGIRSMIAQWLSLPPSSRAAMRSRARHCYEQRYQIETASISLTRAIHTALLQRQLAERRSTAA